MRSNRKEKKVIKIRIFDMLCFNIGQIEGVGRTPSGTGRIEGRWVNLVCYSLPQRDAQPLL